MAKDSEPDATDELTDDQEENMWSQLKVVKEEGSGGSSSRTSVDNPRTKASQENHREQHPHHKVEPISLGVPRQTLNTSLPSTVVLPPLKTSFRHTVLTTLYTGTEAHSSSSGYPGGQLKWKLPGSRKSQGSKNNPVPEDPRLWQDGYVKMPFSQKAQCTVPGKIWPSLETKSKWEVIHEALTKPIVDFIGLKEAILSYNEKNKDLWDFGGLKVFLNKDLDNEKRADFFYCVLPKMAELVLNLPQLCSQPIPLLKTGTAYSITMSQEQAACLLANAFFCTFPWHNTGQKQPNYPGFNFNKLYRGPISSKRVGKLKCLLHYFKTVTENMPQGNLTYSRQVLTKDKFPKWKKCPNVFPQLHVSSEGTIEDDGYGMLQVDFANKTIGGGVLGEGSVQEEIRFVICPELIVSLLFTEVLEDNEAVVITGPQRFSSYEGYARSFQWSGDYKDGTPRDSWGRRCTQVVAIDALTVKYHLNQFEDKPVSRELNKAYVGFYDPYNQHIRTAIATGNWGCGAFGGDLRLKALIQLMAAAAAGRDVCYFTYKDNTLTQDIYNIHQLITDQGLTVGDAWHLIHDYSRGYRSACSHDKAATQKNVFEFFQVRVTKHKHNTNSASDEENEDSDYNNDSASDEEDEDSHNNNDSASDEEDEDSHNNDSASDEENEDSHNNKSASDEENEGTWYHGDISSGDSENEDTWIQVNPDEVSCS